MIFSASSFFIASLLLIPSVPPAKWLETTLERSHTGKIHMVDQYSITVIAESRLVYLYIEVMGGESFEIELREKNY